MLKSFTFLYLSFLSVLFFASFFCCLSLFLYPKKTIFCRKRLCTVASLCFVALVSTFPYRCSILSTSPAVVHSFLPKKTTVNKSSGHDFFFFFLSSFVAFFVFVFVFVFLFCFLFCCCLFFVCFVFAVLKSLLHRSCNPNSDYSRYQSFIEPMSSDPTTEPNPRHY